jgi:hypothetical protein
LHLTRYSDKLLSTVEVLAMDDKHDSAGTAEAAAKKSRHRSPNYPSIGLRIAIGKIQSLYKDGGLAPLMKITALKGLGFDKDDANAARGLAALKSFGLIEEVENDRLKISQRGVDIVARQEGEPQRTAALHAAASSPQIYRELLTEFAASGVPPNAALKSELIAAKKFNPNVVDDFITDFRDTLDFSGLSISEVLESEQQQNKNGGQTVPPQAGDHVQWESSGQVQFPEPKRIRGLSPDGQWAFVDGSETGLPVKELTVVRTQASEKLAEQPPPQLDPLKPPPQLGKTGTPSPAPKMRSYSWALSGDFNAKMDLFGEARTAEDLDALADYVEITIKALKRSLKQGSEEDKTAS